MVIPANSVTGKPRSFPVHVTLICGCVIKARTTPMTERVTYGCTNGLGHGYTLRWVSWTEGTASAINRTL